MWLESEDPSSQVLGFPALLCFEDKDYADKRRGGGGFADQNLVHLCRLGLQPPVSLELGVELVPTLL